MVSDAQLLSLLPFSIGILCLVVGYMIRRRRGLVVVGYEPQASNPRGFCSWVGTHLILLGVVSFFVGGLITFFPHAGSALLLSLSFLITVFSLSAALGVARFEGATRTKKE